MFFFLRRQTTFRTQKKATLKYSPLSLFLSSLGLWLCKRKTAGPKGWRYCRYLNFELWPCTASDTSKNPRKGPSDFRRRNQDTESVVWLGPLLLWTEAVIRRSQTGDYKWGPVPRKSSSDVWLAHSYVLPVLTTGWDTKTQSYCLILRRINFFLRACKIKFIPRMSVCHTHLEAFLSTRNVRTCRVVLTDTRHTADNCGLLS